MRVGASGFTATGDTKAVPMALVERARREDGPPRTMSMTKVSRGRDVERKLTEAHVLTRRLRFQADKTPRDAINRGEAMFIDQHLSAAIEMLRADQPGKLEVAIIEAAAMIETGGIVPITSVGNSASFAILADKVIVGLDSPAWADSD
jgi:succinyl-CoA:acetate CoA-transferase